MSKKHKPPSDIEPQEDEDVLEPEVEPDDEIDTFKSKLEAKEKEIQNLNSEMLRVRADTENFRKRLRKDKEDAILYANEKFIKEILPICENLDRALSAENASVKSLKEGVEMISKQFHSFLEKVKVEAISSRGEKFDPSIHEVLSQIESEEHEENTILEEYSRGYLLNGKMIVPAKVVISKKPEDKDAEVSAGQKKPPKDASIDEPSEEAEVSS